MKNFYKANLLLFIIIVCICKVNAQDPIITNIISEINSDSLYDDVSTLQNFGTRFLRVSNRKSIAEWIKNKFISYGYTNVEIDSFQIIKTWNNLTDTTWQYNVIATIPGSLNPNNLYIIGGHYDSFNNQENPLLSAPGADDNASGVAGVMEIARVFKKQNFQPKSTIQFIAFGAEELMMSTGGCGSLHYAESLTSSQWKLNFMVNLDMISNRGSTGNWNINLQNYTGSEFVTQLAKNAMSMYTMLIPVDQNDNIWSDSYSFWEKGYSAIFLQENELSSSYHSNADTVSQYDFEYCKEISKLASAMLIAENENPVVKGFNTKSGKNRIVTDWNKNTELQIKGYNLYRTQTNGINWIKINTTPITDTFYVDNNIANFEYYYYYITSVDSNDVESFSSIADSAIGFTLSPGILLVDDSYSGLLDPTDSQVDDFYHQLLTGYNYTDYDANSLGTINLSIMGNYSTIIWHIEKMNPATSVFFAHELELKDYINAGGKLFVNMDRFSMGIDHSNVFPKAFAKGTFMNDCLKIDSVSKNSNSRFFGAVSNNTDYMSLYIDTLKTPSTDNHHISNVEAIFPSSEGNIIYNYFTQFDSLTTQGIMHGLPVGVEYIGNDNKVVSLSFPLYYMNFNEAKILIDEVLHNKFDEIIGISENKASSNMVVYPNPANNTIFISSSNCKTFLYNSLGSLIFVSDKSIIDVSNLPEGFYLAKIISGNKEYYSKIIIQH
jgi:hypothetical protein